MPESTTTRELHCGIVLPNWIVGAIAAQLHGSVVPGEGIDGLAATAAADPESDPRERMAHDTDLVADTGAVVRPLDPPHGPPDWLDCGLDLGATWLYSGERRSPAYVGYPDDALAYYEEGPIHG